MLPLPYAVGKSEHMYNFCIIGSGVVGKYLAHHLEKNNTLWISAHAASHTSSGEYHLEDYLGDHDTWQEKAAGLVSFPSREDIALFPFSWNQYKKYECALKKELKLYSLQSLLKLAEYGQFVGELESIFPDAQLHYFWSGHATMKGPHFLERQPYDHYWSTQKPQFSFSLDRAETLRADYFIIKDGQATSLIATNSEGRQIVIVAKRFVVACNTPASMALLERTFAYNNINARKYVGRFFADHAQTSIGLLLPEIAIPRTTMTSFCFQDRDFQGIPYRLEFHVAPPKLHLIQKTRMRMDQYPQQIFERSFMRVTLAYHLPPTFSSRLTLTGKNYSRARVSEAFLTAFRKQRKQLLPHVMNKFLSDRRVVVLNQHFPFFFAGHLTGGVSFPYLVDKEFSLFAAQNVHIVGSATFPTSGLFNPTFTSLVCAKHLLASL